VASPSPTSRREGRYPPHEGRADLAGTEFDCIAVPGGMPGAKTISESAAFIGMLKAHCAAGKLYGAICAAPAVCLAEHKLIPDGALATCHPGFAAKLAEAIGSSRCSEERVVVSAEHKFVTSRGPVRQFDTEVLTRCL